MQRLVLVSSLKGGGGVRQGCPRSPSLFLFCTQLLTDSIELGPFKGVSTAGNQVLVNQLAAGATLFRSQILLSSGFRNTFSAASGLCLNTKKCEFLALRHADIPSICNIGVKDAVTHLGIVMTTDREDRRSLNSDSILDPEIIEPMAAERFERQNVGKRS